MSDVTDALSIFFTVYGISIVCNFTHLLLILVTNSIRPEIYFVRFNPLDHATNMMIIDALCPLSYNFNCHFEQWLCFFLFT